MTRTLALAVLVCLSGSRPGGGLRRYFDDPDEDLRQAARDYLAHDGSGIGLDRDNPWRGDYDASAMLDARRRLRAALSDRCPHGETSRHGCDLCACEHP